MMPGMIRSMYPSRVMPGYEPENPLPIRAPMRGGPTDATPPVRAPMQPVLGQFKKGGKVPKTGLYKLHKGEEVKPVGKLNAAKRNSFSASTFGLPRERKYPMPDRSHAANAKARATQQVKAGNLSPSSAARIRAKANRILGHHDKMVSVGALKA
jgi:hypothetical protein